jgi:hypothetical protein
MSIGIQASLKRNTGIIGLNSTLKIIKNQKSFDSRLTILNAANKETIVTINLIKI